MKRLVCAFWLASCSPAEVGKVHDNTRLVLAAATADVGRSEPYQAFKSGYFPLALERRFIVCSIFPVPRQPILSGFEDSWYSKHLTAAREPTLYRDPRAVGVVPSASLRFTWLRSFDAPVIVRVETQGNRTRLFAKRLSGAGGYGPGEVDRTVERDLTSREIGSLNRTLARVRLFAQPMADCNMGCDGAEWIFEGADGSGYHFMSRWSPQHGPAKAIGDLLIKHTGWRFDEIY